MHHFGRFLGTALALLSFMAFAGCARPGTTSWSERPLGDLTTTRVIVVRHAETATNGGTDPSLSTRGMQRARDLVKVVEGNGVDAVYSTQLVRARETASPTAMRFGLTINIMNADPKTIDRYGRALADDILRNYRGKTVLVVGHSNTVPQLVEALTGKVVDPIGHDEYDRITVVDLTVNRPAEIQQGTY